ncbi:CheC, inhibitor of MCP methylation [Methanohalobium evestigatum Z-7303]|uniref:CheC, inhibitor of MCP methylation n=1 Tax=Methanohalobium evestigatum (strain ATCC BAA-1072 / DSM 3721 / NBRC 107634 / OCM 161 / Z-7303) TaxID=644295 RepID=D7E8U7_METEZ|nr:chemotaxis protein CheC [Methanohalobium evestigatum]ADI73768.1 CheC, inhibitor of MCP methylation [Methanohalobium evestigatum Z-7303]
MNINELSNLQIDAMKEIGNIGMGNATTSLSELTGKRVQLNLSSIQKLNPSAIIQNLPESITMTCIMHTIKGDIQGVILNLFEISNAMVLTNLLLSETEYEYDPEMNESALNEISNILTGSYLTSISSFLQVNGLHSVPQTVTGSMEDILDTASREMGHDIENMPNLETMFMIQSVGHESGLNTLYGDVFFLIEPESLDKLIETVDNMMT